MITGWWNTYNIYIYYFMLTPEDIVTTIHRHQRGGWGDICQSDKEENELSLQKGFRLMSVYTATNGTVFWIITESDRSVTTLLLPDEY